MSIHVSIYPFHLNILIDTSTLISKKNIFLCSASDASCTGMLATLSPIDPTNLRVAAYGNSSVSNSTRDWLPIRICISEIGSTNRPPCNDINTVAPTTGCYSRLDIQIAYTNIGSIQNPQPVLSGVIFHYQLLVSRSL